MNEVYQAHVVVDDKGMHSQVFIDVIEFRGKPWLVPDWLDIETLGVTMPERIISLEGVPHTRSGMVYVVEFPISLRVLKGDETGPYTVFEQPKILMPIPRAS